MAASQDDEPSLEERFQELRRSDVTRSAGLVIRIILWILFAGSLLLSVLGLSGNLNGPIAVRIVLYVLSVFFVVPAILQFVDWSRKSDSSNTLILDRLTEKFSGFILRRKLARFITRYGRQEMAKRLWPDKADSFSVAHRVQVYRRRRKWCWVISTGLVVATVTSGLLHGFFGSSGRSQIQSSVGQEFHIDGTFAITVLDAPKCPKAVCTVEIRFRNAGNYPADIGAGSFAAPENVAIADLCDPSPLIECTSLGPAATYVISLIGDDNHYDYISAGFTDNYLSPAEMTTADFTFNVPSGTRIGELELSSKFKDAFVVFPNSNS